MGDCNLMHYSWPSSEAFADWHDGVCRSLGIPHPNHNAATGVIDLNAQWTTAYTEAVEVASDDWRAFVEDDVAASHPIGLGVPCDPPPAPDLPIP